MNVRILLALVAAAVLTIVPALIEGKYVDRWGTPPDLTAAAGQVDRFPREFGEWKSTHDGEPLAPAVCKELGVAGYISRTYTNRKTGTAVRVLFMVGEAGLLLRHPPYICYANMDNQQLGDMTKMAAKTTKPDSEFNVLEYRRAQSVTNDRFLVAYGMANGPIWKVPALPRIEFGAAPLLYKVQMLVSLDPAETREQGSATLQQFAGDFAAAFQKHLEATQRVSDHKPAT
jgi:hypothetical protein